MSRSIVRIATVAAVLAAIAAPAAADAQSSGAWRGMSDVPRGHEPPAGMCRIWVDGVPPGRQPAPMDCETAVRMKPRNARVVYGDRTVYVDGKKVKGSKHDKRGRDRDRDDDRWDRDDDRRERDDDRWERDDDRRERDDRVHRDDGSWGRGRESFPWMTGIGVGSTPRTAEQVRWLGRRDVRARIVDANRDRRAERVSWYDREGRIVQVWLDTNRDGRADAVRLYEQGRHVRTID